MHTRTHGHHTMVPETRQTPAFDPVSFITLFVYVNKPIYRRNFFVLASFLQAGEGNQQNNQPSSPFLL